MSIQMDCVRWELEEFINKLKSLECAARLKGANTRDDAPTLDERIRYSAYTAACETLTMLIEHLDECVAQHIDGIED
jgi:hypothetical protein